VKTEVGLSPHPQRSLCAQRIAANVVIDSTDFQDHGEEQLKEEPSDEKSQMQAVQQCYADGHRMGDHVCLARG
jgi:hypothetical protein